jgi:hypothetical protein
MNLEYISPADSTKLELQDNSIDIHYSCDVFEHVPPPVLKDILLEAKRVLRSGGVVAHHIDLSDHFALSDPRIGSLNFLKFSEEAWKRLAGNRYMYQNRMRKPEFETLFHETDLSILYQETETDPAALAVLDQPLFDRFASYSEAELAVTALDIVGHFPASITASATLAKFGADSKRLKTKGPRYGGAATIVPGGRKWPTRWSRPVIAYLQEARGKSHPQNPASHRSDNAGCACNGWQPSVEYAVVAGPYVRDTRDTKDVITRWTVHAQFVESSADHH